MPLPTLLTPGAIVPQKWMSSVEKRRAKNEVSLEFITDHIVDRMPPRRGQAPQIASKKIGDKVLLLKSGTGSGKSTTIPPQLYNTFFDKLNKNLAITQPRVLTAVDIPITMLPYNPNLKLGENIGYQTGSISKKPVKGIIFMTVGVLLQQLKTLTDEEIMKKYMFIMIDEVHDRDINVDLTLLYMKKFLQKNYDNPDCPMLILMSATFEKEVFVNYFGIPKENYIEVTGRTYPKDIYYEEYPVANWVERVSELIFKIHTSEEGKKDIGQEFRDILIFVNGGGQIKLILEKINLLNKNEEFIKEGYVLPVKLTSASFGEGGIDYQNLFIPINEASIEIDGKKEKVTRKVIMGTNVAETGVTIEGLKYVIETGFVISAEFNPVYAVSTIVSKNVTKGMSEQRAGRVGRKAPGVVYLLYTKKMYDMFMADQYPQLITSDITSSLLATIIRETESELIEVDIKSRKSKQYKLDYGVYPGIIMNNLRYNLEYTKPFAAISLDFLSYPSADSMQYSLEKLYMLGFITQDGLSLAPYKKSKNGNIIPTMLGFLANKLRKISMESIRMIFAGYKYGCNIIDLITIAVFLEGRWGDVSKKKERRKSKPLNPLKLKNKERAQLYQRLVFADEFIDYLWIWLMYMEKVEEERTKKKFNTDNLKKWTKENNFKYDNLIKISSYRDELIENFINSGYNPFWNGLGLKRGEYNLIKIIKKNLGHGIQEIYKIKKCIYEGYRLNTATYNSKIKKYIMDYKKVPIEITDTILIDPLPMEDGIKQNRPKYIIISKMTLSAMGARYSFSGNTISVIDTLEGIDRGFINNYP